MQVAYPGGVVPPTADPDAISPEHADKARELEMHRNSLRSSVLGHGGENSGGHANGV